jgi:hypothetical protein
MIHVDTIKQEEELLEGYRKLGRESKRLIMTTIITAVTNERKLGTDDNHNIFIQKTVIGRADGSTGNGNGGGKRGEKGANWKQKA